MAEKERVREGLRETEVDPKLYYDYEGRFMESDHLPKLTRIGGHERGGDSLSPHCLVVTNSSGDKLSPPLSRFMESCLNHFGSRVAPAFCHAANHSRARLMVAIFRPGR